MNTNIQMGTDEFILYIRKYYDNCNIGNDQLGKEIWKWINERDTEAINFGEETCWWNKDCSLIGEFKLPYTATQFRFRRSLLPALYDFLDELGSSQ